MQPLRLILINGIVPTGSTYPIEVWALDSDGDKGKYVVKSFRTSSPNYYPTAKEIISTEVAAQFDLPVPSYDIIQIGNSKLREFYNESQMRRLEDGYRFCSRKMEQYVIFNPLASNSYLKDYEIAGIFAFDVMMMNGDRRQTKPNLLINDDDLLMIDHEMSLPFINSNSLKVDYENNYKVYAFKQHALISHLKSIKLKSNIFDEFCEMLHRFNPNSLDSVFDDMDNFGIEYGNKSDYFLYFDWCKKNIGKIRNYLLGMI